MDSGHDGWGTAAILDPEKAFQSQSNQDERGRVAGAAAHPAPADPAPPASGLLGVREKDFCPV